MIWIYSGAGWTVPFIQVLIPFLLLFGMIEFYPNTTDRFLTAYGWQSGLAVGLGFGGLINFTWGLIARYSAPIVIDSETGWRVRARPSFFFAPLEYWGALALIGALVCLAFKPA